MPKLPVSKQWKTFSKAIGQIVNRYIIVDKFASAQPQSAVLKSQQVYLQDLTLPISNWYPQLGQNPIYPRDQAPWNKIHKYRAYSETTSIHISETTSIQI